MAPEIKNVPQDKVGDWAALDTHLFLLHDFLKLGVVSQGETMAYSLGVQ
jgi:hypothetical protein